MPAGIYPRTKEHNEHIRQAGLKRKQTEATKEKCRLANIGKPKSEETKAKIRAARLGQKPSEETIEKLRLKQLTQSKDPAYIKKVSDGVKRSRVENPDILNKMSASSKIRWENPEFRAAQYISRVKAWDTESRKQRRVELNIGGFWYGNVRYNEGPQYCELWNENLRERCRAYFNYTCVECGTPQNGRKLSVHHAHYNKKSCCDGSPRDLVPLCLDCHGETNHNRSYWEQHFTEMIYGYYRGKCFFTKEEYAAYKNSN